MNDQLQKIHDLLESENIDERRLGKQLIRTYLQTADKPDVSMLVVGAAYDVTGVVWEKGVIPCIKTATRIFKGFSANGQLITFNTSEGFFVDRILSISPASSVV